MDNDQKIKKELIQASPSFSGRNKDRYLEEIFDGHGFDIFDESNESDDPENEDFTIIDFVIED